MINKLNAIGKITEGVALIGITASTVIGLGVNSASAGTISFPNFSDLTGWTLNGDAAQSGNKLRLTPSGIDQHGSAFLNVGDIKTQPPSTTVSFNARFQFQIGNVGSLNNGDEDGLGADGFMFVVQTQSLSALNTENKGGYLGYKGIDHSLGIEFDTWHNGESYIPDIDGNHVGINLNGSMETLEPTSVPVGDNKNGRLNNGQIWTVDIDYDGYEQILQARLWLGENPPDIVSWSPIINRENFDLSKVFDPFSPIFFGFTSATGSDFQTHDILNLTLTVKDKVPTPAPPAPVPEPLTILGTATALGFGAFFKRKLKSSESISKEIAKVG
jgi:hypothetical protein